jgi:hypothetical protein
MEAHDAFELDAAFESIPLIDVGERARLRIRIRNDRGDLPEEVHVEARADGNVLLVSANPWTVGKPEDHALAFTRAPLLRGEECEIAVDVYALRAGESTIAIRARCAEHVRELELRCACEGAAAFEPCANRLEIFEMEAAPGADVSGRIILTNTGNAGSQVQLCVEGLDAVRLDPGPALEVLPAQRLSIGLHGRLPSLLTNGSQHEVRAFLTHGNAEGTIGTAMVTVRSRPSITCAIDARGSDWLVRVRNDCAEPATLAIALQNDEGRGLRVEDLPPQESIVLVIAPSPGSAMPAASAVPPPRGPQRRRSTRAALDSGTVRQLQAMTGFVRHLWAIAVLCADAADDGSAALLCAARTALRSVLDRLVIKLRMPQYPLHADDVLDRPAREALCALGAAASGDLPAMLNHAASLIEGEENDHSDFRTYRNALRARLCALRDDGTLIAALSSADSELDTLLDAMLTAARASMTA